jgi:hypothetical protein
MCSFKKFQNYFTFLRTKHSLFANKPICPFIGAEIDQEKITIVSIPFSEKTKLVNTIIEHFELSNNTLLIADENYTENCGQMISDTQYLNELLLKTGIVCIALHPDDDFNISDIETRSSVPVPTFLVQKKSVIKNAQAGLQKTNYYQNWSSENHAINYDHFGKFMAIIFCVLFSFSIHAQTSWMIEQGNYANNTSVSPYAWVWANHRFDSSKFGIVNFILLDLKNSWGEILLGPNYTHDYSKGFIETGVLLGTEISPNPVRGALYVYNEHQFKNKLKSLVYIEYGGSGYWYWLFSQYEFKNGLLLGISGQSFNGVWGPKIGFTKSFFTSYVIPGYNLENSEFGINFGLRATF